MYIPFNELNTESRVWIYQGKRTMSAAEMSIIDQLLHSFCEQWAAHGQPLKTSFKIELNQLIIMNEIRTDIGIVITTIKALLT